MSNRSRDKRIDRKLGWSISGLLSSILFVATVTSRVVLSYSADTVDTDRQSPVLRVVYFVPNDREPIAGYVERFERVLVELQRFFRDGMVAAGYGPRTFSLQRDDDGRVHVYVVQGKHGTETYGRDAGWAVSREVKDALAGEGIDFGRETVLMFEPLLLWDGNKAIEHGPYAGGGNHLSGFAWVYDDGKLDPRQLGSQSPGGYFHRPCSIGEFNSHYIGGIAHELGHAFGLPHVCQRREDRGRGTALMGAGNHTYGREKREKRPGTFLTSASSMLLSTNRLFAGDLAQARTKPTCHIEALAADWSDDWLSLSGKLIATPPIYGIAAYNDPQARPADYDAVGWTCPVAKNGSFRLRISEFRPGRFQLRLIACHNGGTKSRYAVDYEVDRKGEPNPADFYALLLPEAAHAYAAGDRERVGKLVAAILQSGSPSNEAVRKARHLERLCGQKPLRSAARIPDSEQTVKLTDLIFQAESVGWRRPARDQVPVEGGGDCFLEVANRFFESGLYAHAPSRYEIRLGSQWNRFHSGYGLQEGHSGSVVFVVRGDGKERFRSQIIRDNQQRVLDIDLSGVRILELVVEDAGDGRANDWGVWLDPRLTR